MKITVKKVTVKAQGETREVDPTTFAQAAIDGQFTYGVRRWFQDHINSLAKNYRDDNDGEAPSAQWVADAFDSRLAQAVSGEITMRSGVASDPLDQYRIAVLRQVMRQDPEGELKTSHDAIPADETKARREFLLAVAAKFADKIDPHAEALLEADKAKAASIADLDLAM